MIGDFLVMNSKRCSRSVTFKVSDDLFDESFEMISLEVQEPKSRYIYQNKEKP